MPAISSRPGASGVVLGALVLLALGAGGVRGQSPSLRPLAPDHWSYSFLEVLHALGAEGAWVPWQAPVVAGTMAGALEAAGEGGAGPRGAAASFWAARLLEELGPLGAEAGFEASDALPVGDRRGFGALRGEVRAGPRLTLWAEAEGAQEGGASLETGGAAFRAGDFQILAGRLRPALGQGMERILLNGSGELQGVWLGSARPVRIPGLGFLGPVSGHFFVGPGLETEPASRIPGGMEAWFMSTAVHVRPHPRVEVGLMRTTRFAGDSVESASVGRVLKAFTIGAQGSKFADSQGELALRLRVDPFGVSFSPYLSLAFETREAIWEDPGLVAGGLLPLMIGEDLVSVRYEYAAFGRRASWCGGCEFILRTWYHHRAYGPYTKGARPLGGELGGYGSAHRIELQYWSASTPLQLRAVAFRERREEVHGQDRIGANLLLSRWPGLRKGVRLEVAGRPAPAWEIRVGGTLSSTENGGESGVDVTVRLLDVPGAVRP